MAALTVWLQCHFVIPHSKSEITEITEISNFTQMSHVSSSSPSTWQLWWLTLGGTSRWWCSQPHFINVLREQNTYTHLKSSTKYERTLSRTQHDICHSIFKSSMWVKSAGIWRSLFESLFSSCSARQLRAALPRTYSDSKMSRSWVYSQLDLLQPRRFWQNVSCVALSLLTAFPARGSLGDK